MKATPRSCRPAGWPSGTTIPADKPPDFRFRITGIRDDRLRAQLEHPEHLQPPLPTFDAADPLQTYHEVAGRHAELALGRPSCCGCWCSGRTSGWSGSRPRVTATPSCTSCTRWTAPTRPRAAPTRSIALAHLSPTLVGPSLEDVDA
jgi:hypothetical protein